MITEEKTETKKITYIADGTGEGFHDLRKVFLPEFVYTSFWDRPEVLCDPMLLQSYVNAYVMNRLYFEEEREIIRDISELINKALSEFDIYYLYSLLHKPLMETLVSRGTQPVGEIVSADTADWSKITEFFKSRVSGIPEVKGAFATVEDEQVCIWTIIDEKDKEVRRKIYDIEMELMEHFTDISFDFHVIFSSLVDVKEEVPPGAKLICAK